MSGLSEAVYAEVYYSIYGEQDFAADTAKPEASSGAEKTEDGLKLWFDANNEKAQVKAKTDVFSFGEASGLFCARIKFKLSGIDSNIARRVTLYQNGTLNFCELIRTEGNVLSLFKDECNEVSLEAGKEYTLDLAVDTSTKDAWAYFDGVKLYEDNLGSKWKSFDYENLVFELQNTSSVKVTASEELLITELTVTGATGTITSTPENGASFINAESIKSFTLDMGGLVTDETYEGITLTANGKETGFLAEKDGDVLIIVPEGGVCEGTKYVISIPKATDFSGRVFAENVEISFMTADDDYVYPVLEISGDDTVYEGKKAVIKAVVTASEIDRVEFFVDDILEKTVTGNSGEYVLELERGAGEYTVGAIAYDSMGASSFLEEITVTVLENHPTVISIPLEDGMTYKKEELSELLIACEDEDGIEKIEIFVDSKSIAAENAASYIADLSALADGRHVLTVKAYDSTETVTENTISFTAEGAEEENVHYSNDFSEYESEGGVIPDGMTGAGSGGDEKYISLDIGGEHGKVLKFSTNGEVVSGKTAYGSWLRIPTSGTANYFEFEMDLFFEKKADSSFTLMMKDTASSNLMQDLSFTADEITLRTTAGNLAFPYNEEEWYHLKVCTDLQSKTWSIYLNEEALAENTPLTNKSIVLADTRFIMYTNEGTAASVYIDNVSVKYREKKAAVVDVGYDGKKGTAKISPDAKKIELYFNSTLDDTTVNTDNVEIDGVTLRSVSFDSGTKKISIVPDIQLESEKSYTVKLKESILLKGGEALGRDILVDIATGTRALDAINVKENLSSDKAYISCSFVNEGEETEVYAVTSVYSKTKLKATSVEKITVKNGTTGFTSKLLPKEKGEKLTFSVITSLKKPVSVLNKIYEF